jgi:hypothetical protein
MKHINTELMQELDEEYGDLVGLLDFNRQKNGKP